MKLIENAHEKSGQIVSGLLGTAWTVITYFVVPVLVVEKVGPFEAIQRSLAILRRTWGEALVGNIGIGLFVSLLALPWIACSAVGTMLLMAGSTAVGSLLLAVAVAYFLVWLALGPALNGIYVGALYQYAADGQVPEGFEPRVMRQAFRRRG